MDDRHQLVVLLLLAISITPDYRSTTLSTISVSFARKTRLLII